MTKMKTRIREWRTREERGGERGKMAHHKRGLTSWRGGRGRSRLVSLETWHVTNEDSHPGEEVEGGAGWGAWKRGMSQMRTNMLEGRKGERRVGKLGRLGR